MESVNRIDTLLHIHENRTVLHNVVFDQYKTILFSFVVLDHVYEKPRTTYPPPQYEIPTFEVVRGVFWKN